MLSSASITVTVRLHVGAKALKGNLSSYAKRFDLLEVPMDGDVSEATLRRWRRDVPPHFEFVVIGGSAFATPKPGAALDAELERAKRVIGALQARTFLLSTKADVTPTTLWKDRIKAIMQRLPTDATQIVWEPHGVWEVEDAARAAKKFGAVLVVDAARDPVPPGPVAYVRLPALGSARSYSEALLGKVVNSVGDRREAFVVIETTSALKECKTLRRMAQGHGKQKGGGSLVIRPRAGALRVRDDEQE